MKLVSGSSLNLDFLDNLKKGTSELALIWPGINSSPLGKEEKDIRDNDNKGLWRMQSATPVNVT